MSKRALSLLPLLLFACSGWAQVNTATILGTVADPSGAAVASATVTAVNEATGYSRSVVTAKDGSYLIPLLPIGERYRVTIEAQGFRSFVHSGIALQINQNARIDAQLQLGNVSEEVEVSSETPLVD